jgi:hypothetical protein
LTPRFRIGQRARVNRPASRMHGEVCTVVTDLRPTYVSDRREARWVMAHRVDLPPAPSFLNGEICHWSFEPHDLIPLYDPPDPGSWDALEGIWNPRSAEASQ